MTASTERAILAGGCFWGMQDLLRRYPGVISTRVGYTGGDVPNATYRHHGNHAEAIEIIFDPQTISYRRLLEFFFQIHDPTTLNRQGNDRGTSPNFWSRSKSSRPRPRQGHDTAMASTQQPKLSSKWRNDMKDTKTLKETSKF
jgi:methionine-S-sulfoxide reductase